MKPLKIYIAGPYSTPDPVVNTSAAMETWHVLRDEGFSPFCPHLSLFLHMHRSRPYEEWLEYDNEWIEVCNALLRLPGDSSGADKEEALCRSLRIPVFYSLDDLIGWRDSIDCAPSESKGK